MTDEDAKVAGLTEDGAELSHDDYANDNEADDRPLHVPEDDSEEDAEDTEGNPPTWNHYGETEASAKDSDKADNMASFRSIWRMGEAIDDALNNAYKAWAADKADSKATDALWTVIYEFAQGQAQIQGRLVTLRNADESEDIATEFFADAREQVLAGKYTPDKPFAHWLTVCFSNFTKDALDAADEETYRKHSFDTCGEHDEEDEDNTPQGREYGMEAFIADRCEVDCAAQRVSRKLDQLQQRITSRYDLAVFEQWRAGNEKAKEIAQTLGRSEQSVWASQRRISAIIKKQLGRNPNISPKLAEAKKRKNKGLLPEMSASAGEPAARYQEAA